MNIWKCDRWKEIYHGYEIRSGLRLRFEEGVDIEVKNALKDFAKYLRKEYIFPIRVPIYVRYTMKIMARDGDLVNGTFLGPYDKLEEPYIRIAVGNYCQKKTKRGKRDALISYFYVIAHELTHYFQWLNQIEITEIGEERQASKWADIIVKKYLYMKNKKNYNLLESLENKICEKELDEKEIRILDELSLNEASDIRAKIAKILVNTDNERGEQILLRLVQDQDSLVRAEACDSLCISKSVSTYEMLKHIAEKDRIGMVRGYAILSLGHIAVRLNKQNDLTKFLKNRLENDKVKFAQINIYAALYSLGNREYLTNLLATINSKGYRNRCEAVNNLSEVINVDNKEVILTALLERKKVETSGAVIFRINEVIKKIEGEKF